MADYNLQIVFTAIDKATGVVKGIDKAFGDLSKSSVRLRSDWFALTAMIGSVAYAGKQLIDASVEQALVNQKLASSMIALEGTTREQIQALIDYAGQLQKTTRFSDDSIISAQSVLATFKLTSAQIRDLTPRMLDFAEGISKSTGEQVSLDTVARMFGKTLEGNGTVLQKYIGNLKDTYGSSIDLAEITKIVDERFGGMARTMGNTAAGKFAILNNSIGEIKETLGNVLLPIVTKATDALTGMLQDPKNIEAIKESFTSIIKTIMKVGVALINLDDNFRYFAKVGYYAIESLLVKLKAFAEKALVYANPINWVKGFAKSILEIDVATGETLDDIVKKQDEATQEWQKGILKFNDVWNKANEDNVTSFTTATNMNISTNEVAIDKMEAGWLTFFDNMKKQNTDWEATFKGTFDAIQKGMAQQIVLFLEGSAKMSDIVTGMLNVLKVAVINFLAEEAAKWITIKIAEATASAIAAHAGIPFIGLALGLTAAAVAVSKIEQAGSNAGLASGGIVTGPITANLGEGGKKEAVIPLESSRARNLLGGFGGGAITINISGQFLEGDETKWKKVVRKSIIPEIESYMDAGRALA